MIIGSICCGTVVGCRVGILLLLSLLLLLLLLLCGSQVPSALEDIHQEIVVIQGGGDIVVVGNKVITCYDTGLSRSNVEGLQELILDLASRNTTKPMR